MGARARTRASRYKQWQGTAGMFGAEMGVDRWRAICDSGGVDGWPLAVESSFYVVGGGRPASRAMVAGEPAQSVTERVTRRETSGAVI